MSGPATWYEVTTPDGEYLDEVGREREWFASCLCGWRVTGITDDAAKQAAADHNAEHEATVTAMLWRQDARP